MINGRCDQWIEVDHSKYCCIGTLDVSIFDRYQEVLTRPQKRCHHAQERPIMAKMCSEEIVSVSGKANDDDPSRRRLARVKRLKRIDENDLGNCQPNGA